MHTVVQHPVWKGFEPSLDCRTIWETILSGDSWEGSCACCTHTGPASKDTPRMLPLLCGESRLDTRCGNSQAFFWDGWYQRKAFPSVPGNAQRMPFVCCDRTHPLLFGPIWMKKKIQFLFNLKFIRLINTYKYWYHMIPIESLYTRIPD